MLFDRYIFVDWSARSTPASGSDSIWIGEGDRERTQPPVNPHTRHAATEQIRQRLLDAVGRGERVLVGFDFPYGYPSGFAAALGLRTQPPWRAVWDEMADVDDRPDNTNNRFAFAGQLNVRLGGGPGPFWGRPSERSGLQATRGRFPYDAYGGGSLDEFRIVERRLKAKKKHPKSAWQLFGAGCVGSQALLGIPRLRSLRDDPMLAPASTVWPFETGFYAPAEPIVHVEIWPGVLGTVSSHPDEVEDSAQVRATVGWAREADMSGRLAALLKVRELEPKAKETCSTEEGWIFGVL